MIGESSRPPWRTGAFLCLTGQASRIIINTDPSLSFRLLTEVSAVCQRSKSGRKESFLPHYSEVWRSLVSRLVWDQEISQVRILSPRPNQSTNFDTKTAFHFGGLFLRLCPESLGITGFPGFFYFQIGSDQVNKSPETYRAVAAALAWVQKPLFLHPLSIKGMQK